jgi:hypothetical protein
MGDKAVDKLKKAFDDAQARLEKATKKRQESAGQAQLTPGRGIAFTSKEQEKALNEEQDAQAAYEKARDAYYAAR